jgi:hypothetical protein
MGAFIKPYLECVGLTCLLQLCVSQEPPLVTEWLGPGWGPGLVGVVRPLLPLSDGGRERTRGQGVQLYRLGLGQVPAGEAR